MAGGGGGGRRCRRRRRGPSAAVRPPPPPPLRPSAAQRRAGADCGNPEVVVAITGRVLHNALGGSNSATGAGGRAARPAPAQRRGLDTPPPPGPALRAPPRARGRRVRPPQAAAGALPSPFELTRPPAAAAAPPPTNQRRAAPRRAPIGPGGKRGSDRRAGGGRGGAPPVPVPVPGRPYPYSHPYPHPFRRAPPARCPARRDAPRRCLHPPSRGSAPLRSKAQPSLPAAPPVPAGLGAENSPCPFLPYRRAGLRRAPSGRLRGQLPRHYRIFRPGSGAGDAEPPVQRSRLSCWGERGSDGGVPLVNPLGQTGRCPAAAGPPGAVGSGSAPTATSQTSGKRVSIPPSRPFSARTGFLSRREKSRPLRNNQKSETNKKPQKKALERRPGDNPGMLQIRKGGTIRAEIPEKSESDGTAEGGTGGWGGNPHLFRAY
ncbi:translation initiation factor IF-2-like [Molothrus ater]|uniref:translation initiation factor IF-2-like n=1 Tax=Molothrus ater TaxID=84834 RepID=UPI0023E77F0D|nr:translation initiation factor IF-2-like [Molothrus ater]